MYTRRRQTKQHNPRRAIARVYTTLEPKSPRRHQLTARRIAHAGIRRVARRREQRCQGDSWKNRLRPQPPKREARPAAASKIGRKTLAATKAVSGCAASSAAAKKRRVSRRAASPRRSCAGVGSAVPSLASPALAAFPRFARAARSLASAPCANRSLRSRARRSGSLVWPRSRLCRCQSACAACCGRITTAAPQARQHHQQQPPRAAWSAARAERERTHDGHQRNRFARGLRVQARAERELTVYTEDPLFAAAEIRAGRSPVS